MPSDEAAATAGRSWRSATILTLNHPPSAADYRRRAWHRDRWHTALAILAVATLAALVFCLLPLPP